MPHWERGFGGPNIYDGLLKMVERGDKRPVCACGGLCKPINIFNGGGYWLCCTCGHRHTEQPKVLAPVNHWAPAKLRSLMETLGEAESRVTKTPPGLQTILEGANGS